MVTLPVIVPAELAILAVLVALLAKVSKPPVVKVAPLFTVKAPLKLMALPLMVELAFTIKPPVPSMPMPLFTILPFTVAIIPVVVKATPLLIVKALQVKLAGATLLFITASTLDVGVPLLQVMPFQIVVEAALIGPAISKLSIATPEAFTLKSDLNAKRNATLLLPARVEIL